MAEVEINQAPTVAVEPLPFKQAIIHSATKVFALVGFYWMSQGIVRELCGDVNILALTAGQCVTVLIAHRWATGRWFL